MAGLMLAVALALVVDIAGGYWLAGDGRFNINALPGWGWAGLLLFVAGAAIERRGALAWQLATLYFAAGVWLNLLFLVAWYAAMHWLAPSLQYRFGWAVFAIWPVWLALALVHAAVRPRGGWRWPALVAVLLLAAALLAERYYFADAGQFWLPDAGDEAFEPLPPPKLADESVLYTEADRLDAALDAVAPGRAGVVEHYALVVGGDAGQGVFVREATSIRDRFDARFGTRGRSVLLANHDSVTGTVPIATQTSIAAALETIGARMNRDEDVLLLYLTSHGSRDHEFALANPPLELNGVTPQWLADALAEAKIRWRVVIVSACYSGGFVPALAGPEVLVMTAAAADRTSFGCADENDFTYFGKALYDALGQQAGWPAIWQQTRDAVARREAAEHYEPSKPQFSFGAALAARLAITGGQRPGARPSP
ncbi:caspase family protein [Jeongeupia wiesaeckerbachi]|uniref:C13 family peptidase n=1 Tax=Jeongeupia wiesaeckerbachi TaxID=3051218 RepID=UPI003D8069CC